MNTRFACGLAATVCGVWLAGCQQTDTFRAQSPLGEPAHGQALIEQAAWGGDPHLVHQGCEPYCGSCGPYGAGGPHQYHHYGCPPLKLLNPHNWHGPAVVGPDGMVSTPHNMGVYDPGPGWYPRHHHHYSYHVPDQGEFVYPPTFQPPAVVQYPYYTVRGPTDFFMP